MATKVTAKARSREDRAGDPLDGLVNLFDIGIILSVGFLLAALSSLNLTDEFTKSSTTKSQQTVPQDSVITNPDDTTQQVTIEPGQSQAMGVINVLSGAAVPEADATKGVKLTASAEVSGKTVGRPVEGAFGEVSLNDKPAKVIVEIRPDGDSGSPRNVPEPGAGEGAPMELTLHPGETITAMVRATRIDFKDRVEFGTDDSGRNLAHGLIIDNIGLNGLMIPEDATEQRFFITAADWVPESTRYFHLRTKNADGQATRPIVLHIRKRGAVAADN